MCPTNIATVISAIIMVLRNIDYDTRDDVIEKLSRMRLELVYVAPEAIRGRWQRLAALLNATLPIARKGWTITISALCSGDIDPDIYMRHLVEDKKNGTDDTATDSKQKKRKK